MKTIRQLLMFVINLAYTFAGINMHEQKINAFQNKVISLQLYLPIILLLIT